MVGSSRPDAIVRRISAATPRLLSVELEVAVDVAGAYQRPGQYLVLHPPDGKPVFMALASAPGAAVFELLVGPAAAARFQLAEGLSIAVDPPSGNGYPVEMAGGKDLLLFAVGSGMSAMRSVVEHVRTSRERFGRVTLYAGAHSEEDHVYRSLDADWEGDGIRVIRTNSRPWVQDVFRTSPVPVDAAVAFVCGMKAMVQGVTEALVNAGLPADQIWQNF